MKSIIVNKPTLNGLQILKRCYYEFTQEAWVYNPSSYYYNHNLIENFWYFRNEIQKFVKEGRLPKASFIGNNNKLIEPIYNRLVFKLR